MNLELTHFPDLHPSIVAEGRVLTHMNNILVNVYREIKGRYKEEETVHLRVSVLFRGTVSSNRGKGEII